MAPLLLGIDAGLTVTKAVLFDERGRELGFVSQRVKSTSPQPHFVEREHDDVWRAVVSSVQGVLREHPGAAERIVAIGVTAHGDGVYLVDDDLRPVGSGVVSLDTRAYGLLSRWAQDGTSDRSLEVAGQRPFASTPAALLAWFAQNEPERLEAARYALPCKDMIKARLTGQVTTDRTEASLSFVNWRTQEYDDEIFDIFGLSRYRHLLPEALDSTAISGTLSPEAAEALGLAAGLPVAASAHDVDCSALGSGATRPGQLSAIAGTYSINQVISDAPVVDDGWCTRNFVVPGLWMSQAVSPSSATNMEWFTRQFVVGPDGAAGSEVFDRVEREIAAIDADPDEVVYLPYLYGSPLAVDASASLIGMRGWHERGHALRAVMQGVVFNHRWHIDGLMDAFPVESIHLTGGATNSTRWTQMFADALRRPVFASSVAEAGALGVCMLAAVAVGLHADIESARDAMVHDLREVDPVPAGVERYERAYRRYRSAVDALVPYWARDEPGSL